MYIIKVTPPSVMMADGNKVKGKSYEFGCPACKKEGIPAIGQNAVK